jgi:two-component system CheB/CheR fusion protein
VERRVRRRRERVRTELALRESEAKARAIVETTVDGVITIDERGQIESFNDAAEDIFGYTEEEVMGENVKVLMPSPYHEEHDGYIRSYHETGRRQIIGIGREVTGQRKDGSTFPMDLAVSEVHLGDRLLFTGIVRDITERRRLEKEILDVTEQERRRIGQDLHDGLGQMLTGIGLLSQNLARQLAQHDRPEADDAAEITDLIREADQYARDLARGLTPVDLEASGLVAALERLVANAERLFDIECVFEEVGSALVHDGTTATHMYRIAQEAVSNAVRHGQAERIKISLAAGARQTRLRIQDDGIGFPETTGDGPGMGVHIMEYRARIVGGTLDISSTMGEGTTVTCTLPHRAGSSAHAEPPHSEDVMTQSNRHA